MTAALATFTPAELDAERARRLADERAIRRLSWFVRRFWPLVEPGRPLVWNWHIDIMCDALQRQAMGDPEYRRLLFCIIPGGMKSLLVNVFGPAWEWLHDPSYRRLFLSADERLGVRDSRRTRAIITSPEYQALADECARRRGDEPWRLAGDQNEKANFETTSRGFRQCLGISARLTGKRGDGISWDDLIDVKDVIHGGQEAIERRVAEVNATLDQAVSSRVNSLTDSRWTGIMQRLHIDDPAARAIAEGWKVIAFQAEYDPGWEHNHPDDPRTEPGELLFPAMFPASALAEQRRKLGAMQYAAQYQQSPVPTEGGLIKREWLQRYTAPPTEMAKGMDEVCLTVDAARKGTAQADFNALQVWGRRGEYRYLLHSVLERMDYPTFEAALLDLVATWRAIRPDLMVLVEDAANGTTFLQTQRHRVPNLVAFDPLRDTPGKDKSKGARFSYFARAAESAQVYVPAPGMVPWLEPAVVQWVAFTGTSNGVNDDAADAASMINMRWTLRPLDMSAWEEFSGVA